MEVDVHRFPTKQDAIIYLTKSRRYSFRETITPGWSQDIDFYYENENPENRASLRLKDGLWIVYFWRDSRRSLLAGIVKLLPHLSREELATLASEAVVFHNSTITFGETALRIRTFVLK